MAWPHEEYASGRPLRRSPLYDRLDGQRRRLRREARLGAPELVRRPPARRRGHPHLSSARTGSTPSAASTAPAARRRRSSTRPPSPSSCSPAATPRPRSPGSAPNDVARPPGALTYTQMLNARGGIECDLTVARLAEDAFYIVTGTGFATHDFDWIARNIPAGARRPPRRRHLAVRRPRADGAARPRHPRRRHRGRRLERRLPLRPRPPPRRSPARRCIALRITYVGELGWELHVPVEFAATVYDALTAAGRAARPRRRRLPRHRVAAPRKGLPRLGRRDRPRPLAARWPASASP